MNWKKEVKTQLVLIVIALAISGLFLLPKYIVWQNNRDDVKRQFNIVDENDMNATQRFVLESVDEWHTGIMPSIFLILFVPTMVIGNLIKKPEIW